MTKMFIAAVAGFLMVPSAGYAHDTTPIHFTEQGIDYSYTVQTQGNTRILRGSAYGGAEPFELHVTNAQITGTFDGKDVNFSSRDIDHSTNLKFAAR